MCLGGGEGEGEVASVRSEYGIIHAHSLGYSLWCFLCIMSAHVYYIHTVAYGVGGSLSGALRTALFSRGQIRHSTSPLWVFRYSRHELKDFFCSIIAGSNSLGIMTLSTNKRANPLNVNV